MSSANLERTNHYYYSYRKKTLAGNQANAWGHSKWHLSLAKIQVKAVDSHKDINGGGMSSRAINFSAASTFCFSSLLFCLLAEILLTRAKISSSLITTPRNCLKTSKPIYIMK